MPVLTSRHLSSKVRCKVYMGCVRSAMLHGSETWGTNTLDLKRLCRNDRAWSGGTVAPTSKMKHPQPHYSRNVALRILRQSFAVGGWDGMDMSWWRHQMETFSHYWPFVRGIHRSPVNSPHKGQRRGALMFSLICVWINGWVNNGRAGDLRRYRAHYDVTVMYSVPRLVSNLLKTYRFPAPEGKEELERHDLNVSRLISRNVACKTEAHGELVFDIAWCCQPHWMGHVQYPNLKMDVMVMNHTYTHDINNQLHQRY